MTNYKLSIIIPAYNVALYIEETLASILKQKTQYTYEIIIVNDGSTDNTIKAIEKYTYNFPNIQLITIDNSGPATARNVGIEHASGEYIAFVDSDDRLLPSTIEQLLSIAITHNSDLVICGFLIHNMQTGKKFKYQETSCQLNNKREIGQKFTSLYEKNLLNQIWNKVYRRSILCDNHLRFPNYKYGEDRLFVFRVLDVVNTITVTPNCYYEYCMRNNNSLVSKYCDNKFAICCTINKKLWQLTTSFGCLTPKNIAIYDYMFIKTVISCITVFHEKTCPLTRRQKLIRIQKMLHTRQLHVCLKRPIDAGFSFKVMRALLRTRSTIIVYISTYWIVKISKLAPKLFIKAKHFHNQQQ